MQLKKLSHEDLSALIRLVQPEYSVTGNPTKIHLLDDLLEATGIAAPTGNGNGNASRRLQLHREIPPSLWVCYCTLSY